MREVFEKALKHRVEFVREMLKALNVTDGQIDQVIEGYQNDFREMMGNPDAFIKAFREATGLTPEEYVKPFD